MREKAKGISMQAKIAAMAILVILAGVIILLLNGKPAPASAAVAPTATGSLTVQAGKKKTITVKGSLLESKAFKSSNTKIATVSKKGVVTAKKAGNCKVTVTVKYRKTKDAKSISTKKLTCKVTVKEAAAPSGKPTVTPGTQTDQEKYLGERIDNVQLFPVSDAGYVGDPMPYYDKGVFHVFYLHDARDGKRGYHPWALYETDNFYKYEDKGVVIPYADTVKGQDNALGTGSVIKDKDGLYHAFYTGHNDTYSPKEAVMHATSTDMVHWTKIPADTFTAANAYSKDDFRDPYVLYVEEEQQYWMLVVTRHNNMGVLVKYTSKDLKSWKDGGIFFKNDMGTDSNMECPTLIRWKKKWYLSFSDQWPNRLFHYRVSDRISGPFTIPKQDVIDGNGFYAGRLESDGENMYAFGWNATKAGHSDEQDYEWAGNLVVHQLNQKNDGSLVPVLNTSVKEGMKQKISLVPLRMTGTITKDGNNYSFKGKDYEMVEFKNMLGSYLFEATVKDFKDGERFGLTFNTGEDGKGSLNIVFDVKKKKLKFYNTKDLYAASAQSEIDMDFSKIDKMDISMIIADGVMSVYANGQCALTARVYSSQGMTWGIFGINTGIRWENVKLYK